MITEFCMNCGAKFEYSMNKPNFCSSCGSSLNQAEAKDSNVESREVSEASDIGEARISTVLDKLEYSVDKGHSGLTFGDIISQASSSPQRSYTKEPARPKPNNVGSDPLKESIEQCKPSREPEDIG